MLEQNVKDVLNLVKSGNNLGEKITVVGATKTMEVEIINRAVSAGLEVVAENRVQEFREKHDFISPTARQHFIGHLQINKVKFLVGKVELIHSVDSVHLAEEINRIAKNKGVIQDVLIEINVGGELSKSGFDFENAEENVIKIENNFSNLKIKGLMAMLPNATDKPLLISFCKKMRALYDYLKSEKNLDFEYLSMGMSNDFELAIKNGSNMIRLGRTIFGERNYGGK